MTRYLLAHYLCAKIHKLKKNVGANKSFYVFLMKSILLFFTKRDAHHDNDNHYQL